MGGPNYEIVERQSFPSTSVPNYYIPEHVPGNPRATGKPAPPEGTGKPVDPRGTGGPISTMSTGTPGPNYILGPAAAAYALVSGEPRTYISDRYGGPVPIERMNEVWAKRAAEAVREGRRPLNRRSVIRPLLRRARGLFR